MNKSIVVSILFGMLVVGCAPSTPTVASLVKQNSKQIKPISLSPQKTLIGTWNSAPPFYVSYTINADNTIIWRSNNSSKTSKAGNLKYQGDNNEGVISAKIRSSNYNKFKIGDKLSASIVFINDKKIILDLSNPDPVPMLLTKSDEKSDKEKINREKLDKNVKIYYDWLVRREFGDPGPVPQVSNYHRRLAVYEFVLRTGTYPSQEINYAR